MSFLWLDSCDELKLKWSDLMHLKDGEQVKKDLRERCPSDWLHVIRSLGSLDPSTQSVYCAQYTSTMRYESPMTLFTIQTSCPDEFEDARSACQNISHNLLRGFTPQDYDRCPNSWRFQRSTEAPAPEALNFVDAAVRRCSAEAPAELLMFCEAVKIVAPEEVKMKAMLAEVARLSDASRESLCVSVRGPFCSRQWIQAFAEFLWVESYCDSRIARFARNLTELTQALNTTRFQPCSRLSATVAFKRELEDEAFCIKLVNSTGVAKVARGEHAIKCKGLVYQAWASRRAALISECSMFSSCASINEYTHHRGYTMKVVRTKRLILPLPDDAWPSEIVGTRKGHYEMAATIVPALDGDGYELFFRADFDQRFSATVLVNVNSTFDAVGNASSLEMNKLTFKKGIEVKVGAIHYALLGPEDSRAFKNLQNETMLIYNNRKFQEIGHRYMCLFNTATRKEVPLSIEKKKPVASEKNWTFIKYLNATHIVLARFLDPITLVCCDVNNGACVELNYGPIPRLYPATELLRGGSPFYHYRGEYYYSFARVANSVCTRTYRPVFTVAKFTESGGLSWVYMSPPTSLLDEPIKLMKGDYGFKDFCEFRYMLPYSAIHRVETDELHVTLNLRDRENVVVSLSNFSVAIDGIIIDYESRSNSSCVYTCTDKLLEAAKVGETEL